MGFVREFQCLNGHTKDIFEHKREDLHCTNDSCLVICECGHTMGPIISGGYGMLFFEESRPRLDHNLDIGEGPVHVTSYKQHEEAMKARGVELAGARKGGKGCWV